MQYKPHDYQRYAIEYIKTHPIAAVFLDMGLGKTSITLTAINDLIKSGAAAELKLYPDCRHEILNDTCKAEVISDILSFIRK